MEIPHLKEALDAKNSFREKLLFLAKTLRNEEFLNFIYLVSIHETPYARIGVVGAPIQVIEKIEQSIKTLLSKISFPIFLSPLLNKSFYEKRRIYYKDAPNIAASLFPNANSQTPVADVFYVLGIQDVAVLPIFSSFDFQNPTAMLVIVGNLDPDKLEYLKNIILVLQDSVMAKFQDAPSDFMMNKTVEISK